MSPVIPADAASCGRRRRRRPQQLAHRACPILPQPLRCVPDADQAAPGHHRGDIRRGATGPGTPDRSATARCRV